jgi:SAM-dependent MidA family methyltransferase
MEAALYDDEGGFFTSGGGAGRKADFVTSPELGPLFAAVLARALDAWWDDLGRPDPYLVVEAGAGSGSLARDIVAAGPACLRALRYVLVERSPVLREAQATRLSLELPAFVLGPAESVTAGEGDDEPVHTVPNAGPLMTSLPELPAVAMTGVIFANELLDNLPVDLAELRDGIWHEVRVAAAGPQGDGLREVLVPAPPDVVDEVERLAHPSEPPPLGDGARVPLERTAADWLRRALDLVERGRIVAIDYGDRTPALARRPWREWLRTYRGHRPGGPPTDQPGSQDITCEVAVDQLAAVRAPHSERSQAGFLASHGIDELTEQARASWISRAHVGDLDALRARSRVHEAEALGDPAGLGAFRVLEWLV